MKFLSADLFTRPLVLGASISAGYGTRDGGLGSVLARKINSEAKVINKALNGATSVRSTQVDLAAICPSIVLGLDLFFWDAAREQTGKKFEENTRRFFKSAHDLNIPMIIAKVPELDLPFGAKAEALKRSAQKVNALLEELSCGKNVLLYDPLPCFMSMGDGNYFSDGLHLNDAGNSYCADFFLRSLKAA